MKKIILFLFFANLYLVCYCQIVKGTIFDNKTKEIIYSASIYFNGTSVGTLSDQNGNFKIDISKYRSLPLTISAIGYYSFTVKDFPTTKPLQIYLNPKLFELDEVVVKAKSNPLQRMENLTIFRNEFLGTTANSLNCKIANEDDLRFKYNAEKDTLWAFTTKPLIIDNKALGYKITYFLDKFEYAIGSKSFFYSGNIIFKEDSTNDDAKKQYFSRKRKNAYIGSRMHFFRALWINDLNANGFTVRNSANETIGYNQIVFNKNNRTKYLSYHTNLGIAYLTKESTTNLILIKANVYFDATGYYDPTLITWEGEMSRQRIADLLPYDYSLK
jgi:hypothetical protein